MENPARRSTGNRQIDWITMPSVVPMASTWTAVGETVSGSVCFPAIR